MRRLRMAPGGWPGDTALRGTAIGVAAFAIVLELADVWVTTRLPRSPDNPLPFAPEDMAGTVFPLFGVVLVWALPRHPVGWLLCVGGLAAAVNILAANTAMMTGVPPDEWALVTLSWNVCTLALAVLLPLLFPTGRLPSPGWRWVIVLAGVAMVADWVAKVAGRADLRYAISWEVSLAMVLALGSLVVRFKRGDTVERRQLLWLMAALPGLIVPWIVGGPLWWVASLTIPLIPAAIAVAVLRYRLFGIDTLISRALIGAGLAVMTAAVYLAAGGASSLFLSEFDRFAGLAAALFAGAFFRPIHRGLQRGVDRLLYGSTGDPTALAERLKTRLRQADPGHGLLATLEVLREGLAVTGASVRIDGAATTSGAAEPVARTVPLVWHGRTVGVLLIGPPERRAFPAAHDERVIATLTPYIAEAAHAVRLTGDLQASRERILTAREEERRRLRRDLHDGLGQSLGGMAMSINAARLAVRDSPDQAETMLAELRAGMDAVSSDIRELVYGLRPPALDELGLAGAVEKLAGLPVETSGDLGGLPAAVEVAAYRIIQEALNNARKHAGAANMWITLERAANLRITVRDDGRGLPADLRRGIGLGSMSERAAELGGTCTVRPGPGGGTMVHAELPVMGK
ncbi:histidine kinase [Nonomuraea sp. NPDC046570]|uniref:sensor histidine kinase n=1 Tax=Nonomuraea sp. NPDC046570 TaxID=3155255 RepID=UPI0033DEF3CA